MARRTVVARFHGYKGGGNTVLLLRISRQLNLRLPGFCLLKGGSSQPPLVFIHGSYHSAWCWEVKHTQLLDHARPGAQTLVSHLSKTMSLSFPAHCNDACIVPDVHRRTFSHTFPV